MLDDLSRDEVIHICTFLEVQSIVQLGTSAKILQFVFGNTWLWRQLLKTSGLVTLKPEAEAMLSNTATSPTQQDFSLWFPETFTKKPCAEFRQYQLLTHMANVPVVSRTELRNLNAMPEREGHAQCELYGKAFVRGGFVSDSAGWLHDGHKEIRVGRKVGSAPPPPRLSAARQQRQLPPCDAPATTRHFDPSPQEHSLDAPNDGMHPDERRATLVEQREHLRGWHQVYGHRMTSITNSTAIMYGGCESGGYRMMSNAMCYVHVIEEHDDENDELPHDARKGEGQGETYATSAAAKRTNRGSNAPKYFYKDLWCYDLIDHEEERAPLMPRAYHGQCVAPFYSTDATHSGSNSSVGDHLWIAGGLLDDGRHDRFNRIFALDLAVLTDPLVTLKKIIRDGVKRVECSGDGPSPRFGHTMVYSAESQGGGALYVGGGYTGTGIYARHDGRDKFDIHQLNLRTLVWQEIVAKLPIRGCLGRCHTANMYGPLIVYFGGTVRLSRKVVLFDTRTHTFIVPHTTTIGGRSPTAPAATSSNDNDESGGGGPRTRSSLPPSRRGIVYPRLSHAASILGTKLFITGGWCQERSLYPVVVDLAYAIRAASAMVATELNPDEAEKHIHRALRQRPRVKSSVDKLESEVAFAGGASSTDREDEGITYDEPKESLYEQPRHGGGGGGVPNISEEGFMSMLMGLHAQLNPGAAPTAQGLQHLLMQMVAMEGGGDNDDSGEEDEEEYSDGDVHEEDEEEEN